MPCQMVRQRHSLCEDQSLCIYTSCNRFLSQISRGRRIILEKPKHASLHSIQNSHPTVKNARSDFEIIVETTKHKRRWRQSQFSARERSASDGTHGIVGLIAVGEKGNFFRVELIMILWDHNSISNNVVYIFGAHCSCIANTVYLNRRR